MRKAAYRVDGGRLQAIMERKRAVTTDLAEASGVSHNSIRELMRGIRDGCTERTAYRLADALGCEPSAFAARV